METQQQESHTDAAQLIALFLKLDSRGQRLLLAMAATMLKLRS